MQKTYGMPGQMEASILIPVNGGRANLRVKFSGGIPTDEGEIPAKFTTESEIEQYIIESSPFYGNTVFPFDNMGNQLPVTKGTVISRKNKSFPEVESMAEVSEKILELGATAADLVNENAILSFCQRNGLSFPNLKFDNGVKKNAKK